MDCQLSEKQKNGVLGVIKKIVAGTATTTPERIVRNVYDTVYEAHVRKDLTALAQDKALASAQFAAQNLYLIMKMDPGAEMRESLLKLGGNEQTLTKDSITELAKIEVLKKMLNIQETLPSRNPSNVKAEDVAPSMEAIKKAFPQLKETVGFTNRQGHVWNFAVLRDGDKVIKLPEVTDFLNTKRVKATATSNVNTLRAGTMVDMVVREFLNNRQPFDQFVNSMLTNKKFIQQFADYTDNRDGSKLDLTDPLLNKYAENFLKDLSYGLAFIENEYKDYYLTDLTSLLDKSDMSQQDKDRFFLYSAEIGLRGELDILAIAPDGTFRVVDIKTAQVETTATTEGKYNKQTSIYDMIIEKATGLKSQGESDIVYLHIGVSNAANILGRTTDGRYKLAVTNYTKATHKNRDAMSLMAEITKYKEDVIKSYSDEVKVEQANTTRVRGFDVSAVRPGRLKMIMAESEALSTRESLARGKAWLHKIFPELTDKQVQILKMANSNVGGEFFIDAIKLYEMSNEGVAYHEGFHRFSQLFLTKEEKMTMYDNMRRQKKQFTTRDGRDINTATASILDLEEYGAERFREYAQKRDKRSLLASIFDKMLAILKSIADFFSGQGTFAMENMFAQVYTGSFNRTSYSTSNSIFTHLNSLFPNHVTGQGEILGNDTFIKVRDFADLELSRALTASDITISELLTTEGLGKINDLIFGQMEAQRDVLVNKMDQLEKLKAEATDLSKIHEYDVAISDQLTYLTALDTILFEGNDYSNFKGFMRAYYRRSRIETMKRFVGKHTDRVNRIIDERTTNDEALEEKELDDHEEGPRAGEDLEYDRSGNEKEAILQAREELKDFFVGIPRLDDDVTNALSIEERTIVGSSGLPITLSREEAFYKTLVILQGAMTEENIIKRLNALPNRALFPEIVVIRERLLGGENNEGLIPKMNRITQEIQAGNMTNLEEHARLVSFMSHFTSVMSMTYVKFENFTIKLNYSDLEQEIRTVVPLQSRESMEAIIFQILGNFVKGFQNNARESFQKSDKKHVDIYDFMYDAYVSGKNIADLMNGISNEKYLYDPIFKQFYFNSMHAFNLAQSTSPSPAEMKDVFEYMGINLNDNVYSSARHTDQLMSSYQTLRQIFLATHRKNMTQAAVLTKNDLLQRRLKEWKLIQERLATMEDGESRKLVEARMAELQLKLRGYISSIFSNNPINQMLFDSTDRELQKLPANRIFAANRVVFENIAKVEKQYHKNYSSGSMVVLDDLQYSYFLNNQMTIITNLLNEHVDTFEDFDQYPALNHLNPRINPQILNSQLFTRLFDVRTGEKIPGAKISLTNIAQISIINQDESVEAKRIADLRLDEKLLIDILMVLSEGSGEIRRLETSNTAYRLSLTRDDRHRKLVKIGSYGFKTPEFLSMIRGYIQHGAARYQFNQDPVNREASKGKNSDKEKWLTDNLDNLGVFDEMIPTSQAKVKEIINSGAVTDLNTLMAHIETTDPALFDTINQEIADYFEDLTIRNPDSFKQFIKDTMSEKSMAIMNRISDISSRQANVVTRDGTLRDDLIRDYIANDFIMAMEDSVLFFGDYSFYKDPSKRRKIIGNNGSIGTTGPMMAQARQAQNQANSAEAIYQQAKGITSTKDERLIRKGVMADVKMDSKYVVEVNGKIKMVEEVQELRKQIFNLDHTYERVRMDKDVTIRSMQGMEIANAAAWVSLSTYRTMLQREMRWGPAEQAEYDRQMVFMKMHMQGQASLTEEEVQIMNTPTGGFFNIGKFATTGPVHSDKTMPFSPVFDKMGLRVMLPEFDWNKTTRPTFEYMLANNIDYMVFDTGAKGYVPHTMESLSGDALQGAFDSAQAVYVEHAADFFKNQQNTSGTHDVATFSSQLRGIFFEIMQIHKQYEQKTPGLQREYKKFVDTLSDYILVNSSRTLSDMGLDGAGNIKDKATFITYMRERLEAVGKVSDDQLELLSTNANGTFSTFLEALPFHADLSNLISGIIDDNFRKIKLNGSKMYQTPEAGTTISVKREDALPEDQRGTVELKWHELQRGEDGKFNMTTAVEVKIGFSKQWEPLFRLIHPDGSHIGIGNRIVNIKRLNQALRDPAWVKQNYEMITFIGVRIPLQDINFSSHMVVKEFLPEALGDVIVAPPEFYVQTGSDNDIDSVTATFKFLDENGRVVRRPTEAYQDIINRINDIALEMSQQKSSAVLAKNVDEYQKEMDAIRQIFIDNDVYANKGKSLAELEDDLTIVEEDGMRMIKGQKGKTTFARLMKAGEANEYIDQVLDLVDKMNVGNRKISDPLKKEFNELNKKRKNYIKGLTNDIVNSMQSFMELPENYDFLTETDSIEKIKEMAATNLTNTTGVKVEAADLGKASSGLEALTKRVDLDNHENNTEVRSILGSMVKFRKILTSLAQMDLTLNPTYIAGSMQELMAEFEKTASQGDVADTLSDLSRGVRAKRSKTYERTMYAPLLYKKDTANGIQISIFDENGERTTKNLSMIASSLLDLFKNQDVFPSLGISWLNVKSFLLLLAQGVPMERAVLFINNPIIQDVNATLKKLGSDAQDRHAIVTVSQKLFGGTIHGLPTGDKGDMYNDTVYEPKRQENGKFFINKMMRRHGKASQRYLNSINTERDNFRLSEEELLGFTQAYTTYMNDDQVKGTYAANMEWFMKRNPEYDMLGKQIMAYYSTLVEDSDLFYKMYVKSLNRDSTKHNSHSSIATSKANKMARMEAKMIDNTFENKLEKDSTHSPFFKDDIVRNILSNVMPEIFNNNNTYFKEKFVKMIETLTSDTFGTIEYKNKVETKVKADFIEFIYKNFYVLSDPAGPTVDKNGKTILRKNTIFEFFEFDISPLLSALVKDEDYNKFLEGFKEEKVKQLSSDVQIESSFSDVIFANQIDMLLVKYPELRELEIMKLLTVDRKPARDSGRVDTSRYQSKDVFNVLEQNHIYMNTSANPNDRAFLEEVVRDEWRKLLNFSTTSFATIENQIMIDEKRVAFYQNPENITEIKKFFKLLAYYSLAQGSHMNLAKGSFSHLIPAHILKDVVETSIGNFNKFLSNDWGNGMNLGTNAEKRNAEINKMLTDFEKYFRDMNGELNWSNPDKFHKRVGKIKSYDNETGDVSDEVDEEEQQKFEKKEVYKPYLKPETGKLYSKTGNYWLSAFRNMLIGGTPIRNNFVIDIFKKDDNDPLNCKV